MLPLIRNRSKLYDVAALYREPVRLEMKERTVFFRERICNVELHLVNRLGVEHRGLSVDSSSTRVTR